MTPNVTPTPIPAFMSEPRAEEAVFYVCYSTPAAELKGSAEEFVEDAIAKGDGGSVDSVREAATKFEAFTIVFNVDAEVEEEERAFIDRVSEEKLLAIVAT